MFLLSPTKQIQINYTYFSRDYVAITKMTMVAKFTYKRILFICHVCLVYLS